MNPAPPTTGSLRPASDAVCRFRPIAGGGFRAALEVTRRCSFACPHCFVPRDDEEPALECLRALFADLAAAGCRKLLLTGGEPLLRRDLAEIVAAAVSAGLAADLNSTLAGLTARRADELAAAGLREASMSLYGAPEFHDQFVGRAGAYAAACRGCRLLRERGVTVDLHGPVWHENLVQLPAFAAAATELGAGSLTLFSLVGVAGAEPDCSFLTDLAAAVAELRRRPGPPLRTVGFWSGGEGCEQGRSIIGISNRLELSPCLLSRRAPDPTGQDAPPRYRRSGDLAPALAELRTETAAGRWRPACGFSCPTSSEGTS